MEIVVLASGSKGNATYIQTPNTKILIDAGISYLQIRTRLLSKGITLDKIDVIVITHEHTDHIKFLVSIAKKTQAKIFINEKTYEVANQKLSGGLTDLPVYFILANNRYEINDITIVPIKLSHDASCCYGYLFKESGGINRTYGYITDTGYIPKEYLNLIASLQVISLEANHDVKMLKESNRTWPLIQRILSNEGHLSNVQCATYATSFDYHFVKVIILSHLSEECNLEEIALGEMMKAFGGQLPCQIAIAKQNEPLAIIEVK